MEEIKMIGVIVDKHSIDDKGHYRFVYNGTEVRSTSNVLHVTSEKELSDKEIIKRFAGTTGFQEIVRE